jgi:magnesium chelatase subunit I
MSELVEPQVKLRREFPLLPYSYIVEQQKLCQLLEVAYVMQSSVGGVLVCGERGTAKSTIVRSFAKMMYGKLPVTLPINATDDRVMGGWELDSLVAGGLLEPKPGLLAKASDSGMLYIDEVNLLDDHIINIILDVVSTGVLDVQLGGRDFSDVDVSFMLVGTMNPDEGSLRPQLLDRFGLFVYVTAERTVENRREILLRVLRFDTEREKTGPSAWLEKGRRDDDEQCAKVKRAKDLAPHVLVTPRTVDLCARLAEAFDVEGHRAEIVMAEGARAVAALDGRHSTTLDDVYVVAEYAIRHRRRRGALEDIYAEPFNWSAEDEQKLADVIKQVAAEP